MEHITKELSSLLRHVKKETNTIDSLKVKGLPKHQIATKIIERALSMAYTKYVLDLVSSVISGSSPNIELHKTLSRLLVLLEQTKEELHNYFVEKKEDPVTEEYLRNLAEVFSYNFSN
ncbi:hypothetical protein NEFER03_1741 [Nematocida sp. LUAm3]|nr:hypothetical protein NEFER03_1741 [Nematocida sp. LUAm3]KAI5175731.1 hypothetical protein NEFER02_1618 [Nematocida sp. LUAm2]KAI5178637.1 hypothetical protein NEFER01_1773 [Nematocida sp. LUAm1]